MPSEDEINDALAELAAEKPEKYVLFKEAFDEAREALAASEKGKEDAKKAETEALERARMLQENNNRLLASLPSVSLGTLAKGTAATVQQSENLRDRILKKWQQQNQK